MVTVVTTQWFGSARYWYSTQPTETKVADNRAEQLKRDPIPDSGVQESDRRLRLDSRKVGDFSRVHPLPQSGRDVPDDTDSRLVVLGIDHPYAKEPGTPAEVAARAILESRGTAPRLYLGAVRDGLGLLVWTKDSFAYADRFNEAAGRYRGLRCGQLVNVTKDNMTGLLVRPDRAVKPQEEDAVPVPGGNGGISPCSGGTAVPPPGLGGTEAPGPAVAARPKRYYGRVALDSTRFGRDASRAANEVISHLSGLVGATINVTLEIEAQMPDGASEQVVRTVTENGRTLRFTNHGFEAD